MRLIQFCHIFAAALLMGAAPLAAADQVSGEAIYREQCARCHGQSGQGTKKHPTPLVGERSRAQLALVIARTMPDDDPGSCTGEDAARVAAYIHDTFYSPDARARLNPPRVELSHLTVRQYRNTIADLIGSFRPDAKMESGHGLRGEYFASREFNHDKRRIERLDSTVDFNFGKLGPDEDAASGSEAKFNPNRFCIRWEGSVVAPETGVYEFVVKSDQAIRLWVNDPRRPLIDAAVKSGDETEYRGSISLLAGRSFPLRLEFSKGKELKDEKLDSVETPPAFVQLAWKPPKGPEEVISAQWLSPGTSPEVAVVETPFPPDDRSLGWERGTIVSKEWTAAVTDGAIEVAGYVIDHLAELSSISDGVSERDVKLRAFCRTFAERALRRPLTDEEARRFVDRQFDASTSDPTLAVKRAVLRVLTSPRFLYPDAAADSDDYAIASRLATILWDSIPDRPLLEAAAAGKLSDRTELVAQAERMLADRRGRDKLRAALHAWLRIEQAPEPAKDPGRFPEFDASVVSDLRTSLDLFLDDIAWSDDSDFRKLLLSDDYFINGRLAKVYGVDLPPNTPFTKVKLDDGERAGVLTHPYLLSTLAYPAESSPIHRGVFIARGVLGVTLRPPPNAFTPLPVEAHPEFTTRQRVAFQTQPEACARCHTIINPLGFTLERFDAIGRRRTEDRGKLIDASGSYESRAGTTEKFADARQLATYLAGSEEAQAAFAQQMFHHFVKQPMRAYGLDAPRELQRCFAENGFNIRKLVVEIAVTAAQRPGEGS